MKKIAVLAVFVLSYAYVAPLKAEKNEISDARIAAETDAGVFKWKWFTAGYVIANTSVIVTVLAGSLNNNYLDVTLGTINPACCYTIYGAYVLAPTAVAIIDSPTPPTDRLLGKSPEWVNAYTKAYKSVTRRHRTGATLIGCIAGGVVLAATVTLLGGNTPGGF